MECALMDGLIALVIVAAAAAVRLAVLGVFTVACPISGPCL